MTVRCTVCPALGPWGVRSKHFTQEFEAFALTLARCRARDTSEACWSNPRRERNADVADVSLPE